MPMCVSLPLQTGSSKGRRQVSLCCSVSISVCCVQVETKVEEVLKEDKLDAIVCVAGGWAGGDAASPGVFNQCTDLVVY